MEEQWSQVLLEEIRHEVRVIAEGHGMLLRELRETRAELQRRLDEGFADIRLGIGSLVKRLDAHERAHAS
jgi:hypothetical protein